MKEINISVNNDILHDIQLMDTQMISLHCNVDEGKMKENKIQTNIEVNTKGIAKGKKEGDSIIEIRVTSEAFELKISQMGKFINKSTENITEEMFENFLATQGIRLLWSFARENIYEISCKMLRKPILLPTLDVMKAIKQEQ